MEVVQRCENELRAAEATCAECEAAYRAAMDELEQAKLHEAAILEELNVLRKELSKAIFTVKDIQSRLDSKRLELQGFRDGPLSAYKWLCDNAQTGQYDTVRKTSMVYKHDSQVSDKVNIIVNALGRYSLLSVPCKDMLTGMVPGSLGPAKNERDEFQSEGVEMIGRALRLIIEELERQCHELEMKVASAKEELSAIEMRVSEAGRDLQEKKEVTAMKGQMVTEAKKLLDEATKDRTIAQKNVSSAEAKVRQAESEKLYREDLYNGRFLPLMNGKFATTMEASSHLDVLRPALQKWDMEVCLLAAFGEAGKKYPADRREWCTQTMRGVDNFFQDPLRDAESKWVLAKEELESRRRELLAAEDKAEKYLAEMETEYRRKMAIVKDLTAQFEMKLKELATFKEVVFEAYMWLSQRTK